MKTLFYSILLVAAVSALAVRHYRNFKQGYPKPNSIENQEEAVNGEKGFLYNILVRPASPIPIWGWVLLFVFGASSFGMMVNNRSTGYLVFGAIFYYLVQSYLIALDFEYKTWPFYALIAWILITGGLAKQANEETLEKHPWMKERR
ncbi:MAG: hypothetical protein H6563_15085 [Lewinellaceae bacterium]|nr:hypothetical protein [Lewinellaceae bacterium]